MSILIRIDTIDINSGECFFADEEILVQLNEWQLRSNRHNKAIRAAAIHGNAIIEYGILVPPCANGLITAFVGNHAAIAVECKCISGKL